MSNCTSAQFGALGSVWPKWRLSAGAGPQRWTRRRRERSRSPCRCQRAAAPCSPGHCLTGIKKGCFFLLVSGQGPVQSRVINPPAGPQGRLNGPVWAPKFSVVGLAFPWAPGSMKAQQTYRRNTCFILQIPKTLQGTFPRCSTKQEDSALKHLSNPPT